MTATVLDLFSAAAGGWSLGMHRAGFTTIAACESVEWRRILYSENNPDVRLYDDVCTLTADRLRADLGALPDIIVGSPPCQDISSANTKGKGVDGERSGLFFEAVRIIGDCRPRWFAFENSAHLRTKGADRVLAALEALGYSTEAAVVGADDVGANHERKRSWLVGFDPAQLADADGHGWPGGRGGRRLGLDLSLPHDPEHPPGLGHEGRRSWGHGTDGDGATSASDGHVGVARNPDEQGLAVGQDIVGDHGQEQPTTERAAGGGRPIRDPADPAEVGREGPQPVGPAPALRRRHADAVEAVDGSHADDEGQPDGAEHDEMGGGPSPGHDAPGPWSEWNGGLAGHLRLDDGLSAWVAGTRVAVGGPRGTAAASLLVEAFGDAVLPQIPEAIGRAILRTEAALAAIYGADASHARAETMRSGPLFSAGATS